MKEKAFFVFRPRTAADLSDPDAVLREVRIVKTICLNSISFENFTTDLLADRLFLGDNTGFCTEKDDCLLISGRGYMEELLVIPQGCYVRYAALRPAIRIESVPSAPGKSANRKKPPARRH